MGPEPVEGDTRRHFGGQRPGKFGDAFGSGGDVFDVNDAAVIGEFVEQDFERRASQECDRPIVGEGCDESQGRNYGRVVRGAAALGNIFGDLYTGGDVESFTLGGVMWSVSVSNAERWTVLRVRGEIDMATCPQLRQEIVAQISQGNYFIIVDLDGVDFIDSTGLGVLIGGLKRARSQGGDLRVSGVDERLGKVFNLTGLGDVLAIVDLADPEEALGAA